MNLSPVILFTYNRPTHTSKVLKALKSNHMASDSVLYIYQDGIKEGANTVSKDSWEKVNKIIHLANGFKKIIIRVSNLNKGCGKSITEGITEVFKDWNSVIVVEDDILVSKTFLEYMNYGLNFYENNEVVGSINAYSYEFTKNLPSYFFLKGVNPYGWGSWKRCWNLFNPNSQELLDLLKKNKWLDDWDYGGTKEMLEATINSNFEGAWDVKWYTSLYVNDKLGLFPSHSYSNNIGFDEEATHTHNIGEEVKSKQYAIENLNTSINFDLINDIKVKEDIKTKKYIQRFYRNILGYPTGINKVVEKYYLAKHFLKTNVLRIYE